MIDDEKAAGNGTEETKEMMITMCYLYGPPDVNGSGGIYNHNYHTTVAIRKSKR
ncbi:hypothetical protein LOAG_06197 [Loa loa]|uniref:Uncharacterized protein n=1 Tax=Loa loa TaxID=7209 RepID=A0A1S0TYH3_LOALO|nr:hypothetical protein LOAG_06197 [Loa loa]EFO22292.2 hypothetical protein LOAG_06197 [Loa loa]